MDCVRPVQEWKSLTFGRVSIQTLAYAKLQTQEKNIYDKETEEEEA